jgi:hypothetical protein
MIRLTSFFRALFLFLGIFAWCQFAVVAQSTAPAETESDAVQPSVTQPSTVQPSIVATSETEEGTESNLRQEHVIYLPFEKLSDVFEEGESSIVLPYAQFLEMWNQLIQPEPQPPKPPVGGIITRADYTGEVRGELVHLETTLDVEVLTDEWAQLPVEFGDAAIGSAEMEDEAVLLRGVGEGRYELLVHGRGIHQIKLGLVAGVISTTEGRSFTVKCPSVGVSNLELKIPETDLAVQVTPRRSSELQSDSPDTTRVIAVLGSTNQFTVHWQPKSGGTDEVAGLANVTDTIAVDVGDGIVHTHALLEYDILRGSLSQLQVEIPSEQRLLDVQVPGLRDWRTEMIDDRQRVTARLHAPATKKARLQLHTEAPISEEAFLVGQVRAVGVARESGILAVRSAEDVGLEYVERKSITRIDVADVSESLHKSRSTFYKFFSPDHELSVVASQLQPRVIVDSHLSILLDKARLTTRGAFHYQVSRSGIFSLAYRLPAGLQVDDVQAESMERFEAEASDTARILTVYFTKKMLGKLAVTVTASKARDNPSGELMLPLLEPLHATREQALVAVIAPESLEVKTESAQLQSARAATPAELLAKGFRPKPPQGSALAAAFSFVTRPVQIVQTITERPRRTTAAISTIANVREDVVHVTTTFRYRIQFAGTDTFRIAVPEEVSDRLQLEGDGIKERRRTNSAGEDEVVVWTVILHSEAIGDCTFTAQYDRKLSIPEEGTTLQLEPIKALDVDRETGEIAIQKQRSLSIDATPTGLEEIDPRELSQPLRQSQPYLAYRYYQHPAQLSLGITKHEIQDVVETVVRRAYIEAVLTEEGPITVRARYELKSSERQRLAVTLHKPRILGFSVAGRTVAPEKAPAAPGGDSEEKTYLINVARTTDSNEPFQITMVFETPLAQEKLGLNDILRLPLPKFEDGVKFQQTYVRIWVPKDYRLVGNPEGFTSHIGVGLWDSREISAAPDNPDSWFTQDASSFDFQVGGTTYLFSSLASPPELGIGYWYIPVMTLVASLVVLVVGIVLVPFSFDTKVLIILAAVLAVLLTRLFYPSVVQSWLLAARIGIAGVIALWLVVWLLWARRTDVYKRMSERMEASAKQKELEQYSTLNTPGVAIKPSDDTAGQDSSTTKLPGHSPADTPPDTEPTKDQTDRESEGS